MVGPWKWHLAGARADWAVINPADCCCQQCNTNLSRWHLNATVNSRPWQVPPCSTPFFLCLSVLLSESLSCVKFSHCLYVCLHLLQYCYFCLRLYGLACLSPFKCTPSVIHLAWPREWPSTTTPLFLPPSGADTEGLFLLLSLSFLSWLYMIPKVRFPLLRPCHSFSTAIIITLHSSC